MKKKFKTNVIHIRLDDSDMLALRLVAQKDQRTLSQIARMILQKAIAERRGK